MEANGIPIMALVDSGSTISMIHPSVLDRIQRGHDVTLVGDMGQLCVEDGRTVETHGVVQLSLRVGTDPSRWCYTCRWHGTTARWRRQNSGNPWGSTTELESWYGPFTSIAWDGGRRDERASHNANVLILWWWIIAYLMPLVGPLSSRVGPTIAGSSRDAQNAICLHFMRLQVIFWPYILNMGMLWWDDNPGQISFWCVLMMC